MRVEAILTQLVFEHSMRIRINALTSEDKKPSLPPDSTPDSLPVNEATAQADSETTERTDDASPSDPNSESIASTSTTTAVENTKDAPPDDNKLGKSLIGIMTNLVTTDMNILKSPIGHLLDIRPWFLFSKNLKMF